MERIILASSSPRRKELLNQLGVSFLVKPSYCKEIITDTNPAKAVVSLAGQKAADIASGEENAVIIGADTIVAIDNVILGKPADEEDARRMLKLLQGRTHQVYTGVAVIALRKGTEKTYTFYSRTDVTFYPMTDREIDSYIKSKEPMDKAGAYGIQGKSAIYIEKIDGDYNTVIGLPAARLYQTLKQLDIQLVSP